MKIALALILFAAAAFAADSTAKAEKEVAAAMDAWKEASVKGDEAALNRLYSDDLVWEHSTAKNENKAEAIKNSCEPTPITTKIELRDVVIRIYGNTALVKSKGDFSLRNGGVNHLDTLMVWVKAGQGWQVVARQSTKLP